MFLMTKKDKVLILFALTALVDKLNIKEEELITTEKQNKIFDKILKTNKGIFKNKDELKNEVIKMFNNYVNKLK